jgi:hypothetical protein
VAPVSFSKPKYLTSNPKRLDVVAGEDDKDVAAAPQSAGGQGVMGRTRPAEDAMESSAF